MLSLTGIRILEKYRRKARLDEPVPPDPNFAIAPAVY